MWNEVETVQGWLANISWRHQLALNLDAQGLCLFTDAQGQAWQIEVAGELVLLACHMGNLPAVEAQRALALLDANLDLQASQGAWFARHPADGAVWFCISRPVVLLDEHRFESLLFNFMDLAHRRVSQFRPLCPI